MGNQLEILTAGLAHHRKGEIADAERCYRDVIAQDPNQPDAFQLLGVVLFETGRTDEALQSLQQAIRINPHSAEAHFNLGRALHDLHRHDDAIASYSAAIDRKPSFVGAHYNLGNLLRDVGRTDEAIQSFRRAISHDPKHRKALANLGHLLLKRREFDRAIESFEGVVAIQPDSVSAICNLGKAFQQRADIERGDLDRAESLFQDALRREPDTFASLNLLGALRLDQSRYDGALAIFRKAVELSPDDANTLSNLGAALIGLRRLDEAIATLRRAIVIKPDSLEAHTNLAAALFESGQFAEARANYRRAIEIDPQCAEAHFNLGVANLLNGDFEHGWPEYDWRPLSRLAPTTRRAWDGSSLTGKSILLYPEQGMGDTIQFIRFASVLHQQGARVMFGCPEPLRRLLVSYHGIDELLPDRAALPAFDCYVRLLSLPGLLKVNLDSIPAEIPYLSAPTNLIEFWKQKLAHIEGLRVGITWQGNPKHKGDRQRSVPLMMFEPLSRIEGVRLISLQQGTGVEQLASHGDRFPIYNPGPMTDFAESAALMKNLDLIITIDSAAAHLAGALGLATWVVLPFVPDWRWLLNRTDSPWYPTMRLFRQTHAGDWAGCFDRISGELNRR